jgi:hypothetical protein
MNDRLPNPYCPICGEAVANGIGPADLPLTTKFLHMLPSSHLFYDSANLHDRLYHIGRTESDRKNADKKFLEHMLATIKMNCAEFRTSWYKISAYRNYYAVRWFGGKFFNYKGCK